MTNLQWPTLALIDLDGTLVDSAPDLSVAANLMLTELERDPVPSAQIQEYVGNGIDRFIHRCLTGQLEDDADNGIFSTAHKLFCKYYALHNGRHSRLYPGVHEGILQLQERGITLSCITNKAACFSDPLLKRFEIRDCFSLLVSGDTLAHKKPHPQPLLHAAHSIGVAPASCLMIGDSSHDIAAARAAGMPVVAVSYGYNHGCDIRDAGPDAIIDRLDQLGELFTRDGHRF